VARSANRRVVCVVAGEGILASFRTHVAQSTLLPYCRRDRSALLHTTISTVNDMEPFEDENPFSTMDPPLSSASSHSHVDVSAPSSPPIHAVTLPSSPPRIAIQTSPLRTGFPSQGSGHSPRPPTSKSDFCCIRDHWLHSGEDVEILVSAS
jgi:hypothetical protein